MTEQIQNNTKDIDTTSQNNISSDNSKNQIPLCDINSNSNPNFNSLSHENIFNEFINSTNYQESKGNSSFYNFSETIQSNQDNINANTNNSNIVMSKEKLYQTFLLFQKFLNNINNSNNILNNKTMSQNRKENKNVNKNNYKNSSAIYEINELNYLNDSENEEVFNGKDKSEANKANQKHKIYQNHLQNNEDLFINNDKELIQGKNHYNIINGGNNNILFFSQNMKKDIDKDNKSNITKLNEINKNGQYRNSDDMNNKDTKNSYDDIPIKFNKENFIDLVEKKLADEKKNEQINQENTENKPEILQRIKPRKEKEKNKNRLKNEKNKIKNSGPKENINKDKNANITDEEKDKTKNEKTKIKLKKRKKNNISNNYSFDREDTHTHILNDNKTNNNFDSSSIFDNLNSIINKSGKKHYSNSTNDNNIIISKEDLNKLFLNNLKENIKDYKINKLEICLISNRDKKKNELENSEINTIDQKEQLINQKLKEINKEMVKIKEERNKVNKIKVEYEKSLSKLNNDLYQFNQKKEEFEKYRKNEINKIKNDKKAILLESKNIKDIKSQNQALIMKAKKDKENIDELKNKITELQSLLKQKDNMNNLTGNYNSNTFKPTNKRSSKNKISNIVDLDIDTLKSNPIIDGYFGNIKNNSIRSMTNINNIFPNTIEDKIKNRINSINKNKGTDLENISVTLKRNNSSNRNYAVLSKKIEVIKNINKSINSNNLTSSNLAAFLSDKNLSVNNMSESGGRLSLSKKTQKNLFGSKDIMNERVIFSPQASRTSIGFGLKKLNINLNNTPKENVKVTKKIYENKNKQNIKKPTYSKTTTNNLSGSIINNMNSESNQNSYLNNTSNNNKISSSNKKTTRDKLIKRHNTNIIFNNNNKITKRIVSKQNTAKNNNDIIISKSKTNLLNKNPKNKKKEIDILNNSINDNNNKKIMQLDNKAITTYNISRNINTKNNEKINISESNLSNKKNNLSLKNNKVDEYDFIVPEKYLNKEYKLVKTLQTDDKIINLYTNEKKEIIFKSGVRKEIYQDGHQIIYFVNGDLKQIYPDGKSYYFFKESKTVQINLNNGMEIYKFENGQIEKHYPNGTKSILFNDGSERYIYNDEYDETYFSDGNVEKVDKRRNVIVEKLKDNEEEDDDEDE